MGDEMRVEDPFETVPAVTAPADVTDNEELFRLYFEADQAEKVAKARKEELRKEIEPLLGEGEYVGNDLFFLTYSPRSTYEVDSTAFRIKFGPEVFAQCAEVNSKRLKEALDSGSFKKDDLDGVATEKIVQALVIRKLEK